MIASSLREGDDVVDLLLRKDADTTMKSASFQIPSLTVCSPVLIYSSSSEDYNGQVCPFSPISIFFNISL